jgi:hypothetical protein
MGRDFCRDDDPEGMILSGYSVVPPSSTSSVPLA